MNLIFEIAGTLLRGVTKLAFLAITILFVLGVLCIGLVLVLAAVIRYALTGRKPAVVTMFTQFQQTAQRFRPGQRPGRDTRAQQDDAEVVDVQAHEVHPVLHVPAPAKPVD